MPRRKKKGFTGREKFITFVALVLVVAISGVFFVYDGIVDEFRLNLGLAVAPSPSSQIQYVDRYTYNLDDLDYASPTGDLLDVHFIDVLQGDAVFIELPDGKTMLIDAGRHDTTSTATTYLIDYLTAENVDDNGLDYLVLTHSDADHVGGMDNILQAFSVRNVFMPELGSDRTAPYDNGTVKTATFEEFLFAVSAEPDVNVVFTTEENEDELNIVGSNYSVTFYCAPAAYYEGVNGNSSSEIINNMSSVVILEYAGRKVLLTGDLHSESEDSDFAWSESHLIDRIGTALDVDVYKLGHHGSHSSSSLSMLQFFTPEVGIACVGDASQTSSKNSYSHPRPEALNRLVAVGCNFLFRTDRHGSIVLSVGANGGMRFATQKDCANIFA